MGLWRRETDGEIGTEKVLRLQHLRVLERERGAAEASFGGWLLLCSWITSLHIWIFWWSWIFENICYEIRKEQ